MEKKGPKPNAVTFVGVLTACNHKTLVNEAWRVLGRMSKVYSIAPEIEHYGCMVDLLARAGRVNEAEILIRSMAMEPDGAIWGSLLNGCLIHGHFELAGKVGKLLIQLEPQHSGRYVLLANMYAKMENWEDVLRLRKMMKDREVVSISAWSFIEIDGVVHKFLANDKSHSHSRSIYQTLSQEVSDCKGTRQVDILYYCVSLSHKLLQGTENYIKLHQIVDETVKKLQAEVSGLPVNMRRVIFWHCKAQNMNYPAHQLA
ncbi:pentatricopeptide repeat-containing protein At5g08510-like [Rosa rugosa]|uniref:pentatricopeptide repeat-containing protein At5g08510-like n=1 Tax=Rosa rugosa TaxID=74645 RepID=UPI002B413C9A|nr:pentatricopeptide repeat-containing protein At5g08510-like [Rosa rugosa]